RVQIGGDDPGKGVLEPLLRLVREGEVVRIGAGDQTARLRRRRGRAGREEQQQQEAAQPIHFGAAIAPHGFPPRWTVRRIVLWATSMIVSVPERPEAA